MAFKTKPNVEKALSQFMEIATTEVFHMRLHFSCRVQNKSVNLVKEICSVTNKQCPETGFSPLVLCSPVCNFGQLTHNLVPTDIVSSI